MENSMTKKEIHDYIHKHKDKYKLKSLEKELIKHGAKKKDINEVIKKIPPSYKVGRNKQHNHIKSILIILGLFIILSFLILIIISS